MEVIFRQLPQHGAQHERTPGEVEGLHPITEKADKHGDNNIPEVVRGQKTPQKGKGQDERDDNGDLDKSKLCQG